MLWFTDADLVILSLTVNSRNTKTAHIAAHLNAGVILCSVRYSLPLTPTSWDLGPRQDLFGDNSLLNKFNHVGCN